MKQNDFVIIFKGFVFKGITSSDKIGNKCEKIFLVNGQVGMESFASYFHYKKCYLTSSTKTNIWY